MVGQIVTSVGIVRSGRTDFQFTSRSPFGILSAPYAWLDKDAGEFFIWSGAGISATCSGGVKEVSVDKSNSADKDTGKASLEGISAAVKSVFLS